MIAAVNNPTDVASFYRLANNWRSQSDAAASVPAGMASGQAVPTQQSGGNDTEAAFGPAYKVELSQSGNSSEEIRQKKRTGQIECQTCKNRQYQDGSNDPGVSFKAPGHIAPESSAAVVASHEQEHVSHEQAKARNEGRRVVAQSVRIFTSVCPECGRVYVSGGQTSTTTASQPKQQEADKGGTGQYLDLAV